MIDMHAHIVPPANVTGLQGPEWPRLEVDTTGGVVLKNDAPFRRVKRGAFDLTQRLRDMESAAVDFAVVSPMPEYLCYWAEDDLAADHCRAVNSWVAEQVTASNGVLEGIGILPLQNPVLALEMVHEIADLGLLGVEVGSSVNGKLIGSPEFHPFFEACSRLGLLVFVHTFEPKYADQFGSDMVGTAAMFPIEITYALHSMVASGLLASEKLPKILVSHGGGGALHTLARLQWMWDNDIKDTRERLGISPQSGLRRLYFDSLVFGEPQLRALVDAVGSSRVCLGSDYPFVPGVLGWNATADEFQRPELDAIRTGTASWLLGHAR